MSVIEIIKGLIKEYKYEISTHKYGFLGLSRSAKIQLKEEVAEELFVSLVSSLNCEFGVPAFMHAYYGLIWNKDCKYISCNVIEEVYGSEFIDLFVFEKVPLGKKLTYENYCLIDEAIRQVFEECGFKCNTLINYNRNGFAYGVSNEKTEWLLQLKGNNISCYFSDVTIIDSATKRVTPRYWCKKIVNSKNPNTIEVAMKQSFSESQLETRK